MTENQISELFRLMGVSIQKIERLETGLREVNENLNGFKQETRASIDDLKENLNEFKQETRTSIEDLQENLVEFKQETKQSFTEVKQELRFMNRKIDVQTEDLMDTKVKVRDHEERLRDIEKEVA